MLLRVGMDAFRALLGSRIKLIRKQAGMNQAQLAEASGVEINTISRYETGKSSPSVEQLLSLAAALKVSPIAILSTHAPVPQRPVDDMKVTRFGFEDQHVFKSHMEVFRNLLGTRIRNLRKAKDMNQFELAQAAGLEIKAISRYETGRAAPSVEHLLGLSSALGVSPLEILPPQDLLSQRKHILQQDISNRVMKTDDVIFLEKILLFINSYRS